MEFWNTIFIYTALVCGVNSIEFQCNRSEYFDPSKLSCQSCPLNVSMVTSTDGFSCVCEENSVPIGVASCKTCNTLELVSTDGTACVPRKCQTFTGRVVCRKCPADYISVTQNLDGSPTKEVLCVKCARGYRPKNNACVRCPGCACTKTQVSVRGVCVPRRFLSERPKYEGNIRAIVLLDVIKHEYLCTMGDLIACRVLANECVRNYYNTDASGPCRLWIQPKTPAVKGLPALVIAPNANEMDPGDLILPHGKNNLSLILVRYTSKGQLQILKFPEEKLFKCFLPVAISLGTSLSYDCAINISRLADLDKNSTFSVFLERSGDMKLLPITLLKPGGYKVKRETWSSGRLARFFLVDDYLTANNNITVTTFLRTFLVKIRVVRDKHSSSLRMQISLEVHYSTKSQITDQVTVTLRVQHKIPSAGIHRGLEIWGGVLGSLLSLYAIVQWRGELRRGGLHFSLLPHLAGSISDALYFATWLSTLQALAAEAGALGLTLSLSQEEEQVVKALVYSAVTLKAVRVAWLNWKHCTNDLFFLDWVEYNNQSKESPDFKWDWRATTLAREWSRLQTIRRAPPLYTIVLTLVVLQVMNTWDEHVHLSRGYAWAAASLAWWGSYGIILTSRWVVDKFLGSPFSELPKICRQLDISLLVFQEENYAHYVHGRNNDNKEERLIAGPLAMCRVVMTPQMRIIYNQLSSYRNENDMEIAKQSLLSRLLGAFFERALDGLSWVASERILLERLLDVELTERESGCTSVILYDMEQTTPSCEAVTWWGNEWNTGSFDGVLFGSVMFAASDPYLAALITLLEWQVIKGQRQRSLANTQ
ncbi:hypothetical protein ACJJTC_001149 [Scirpophaga incertulas]